MPITVYEIIKSTGGQLLTGNPGTFSGVSIDSRSIAEGELFIALAGEKFNGHDFLDMALLKGAGSVVSSIPGDLPVGKVVIRVKDTLRALQDLAHYLRMKKDIPVVAVTGSNGKTTTKEMVYSVLSRKFLTLKNEGNLNNHVGLPLSLTRLEYSHEAAVLEMGMNAPGEIRRLCDIAVPTHGIITNIGSAHVGRLGSREAIRDAKLEILKGLQVVIANADDDFLMDGIHRADKFDGDVITFSVKNNSAYVTAKEIKTTERGSGFELVVKGDESMQINLNVHGEFNIYNALAAAAAGFSLGVPPAEIKEALESFRAFRMRFEIRKIQGITLINDSYNANPSSMAEAIKAAVSMGSAGRTIAVLGDMGELEEFSDYAHKEVGREVSENGIDVFVAVGRMMSLAAEECIKTKEKKTGTEVYTFRDADEAEGDIMNLLKKGDTVLVKGSRAMHMDRVADRIIRGLSA